MKWKVLVGFLAGVVLATTGSYWLEHRNTPQDLPAAPIPTATTPMAPAPNASAPSESGPIATVPAPIPTAEPIPLPTPTAKSVPAAVAPARRPIKVARRVTAPRLPRYAERASSGIPTIVLPAPEPAKPQETAVAPTPPAVPVETRAES